MVECFEDFSKMFLLRNTIHIKAMCKGIKMEAGKVWYLTKVKNSIPSLRYLFCLSVLQTFYNLWSAVHLKTLFEDRSVLP